MKIRNSKTRTQNSYLNVLSSLLLQVITAVSGLVLPRILIPQYGSALNGLVASITQFLSYITLLEGGVEGVFRATLYKPLYDKDFKKVSGIVNYSKLFYRRVAAIYICYIAVLCVFYPFINDEFDRAYVISLILILCVSNLLQYLVSLPYITLINADQKARINSLLSSALLVINIIVIYFLASVNADFRIIKLSTCIIYLASPVFYYLYVKTHYTLSKDVIADGSVVKQKWNGLIHHFAYFIHNNTDVVVLTFFMDIRYVSVYSVYLAIVTGIQKVISSIVAGTAGSLGNVIASGDKEKLANSVNMLEFAEFLIASSLYTITALMLMPFIRIYTANMKDINYIEPIFGYILIIAEAIYSFRCVYSSVSMGANHYKGTQPGALLECITNLVISVILVFQFGLIGVAIGTAVSMTARYLFEIWYLSHNILYRSPWKSLKILLVSCVMSSLSIIVCRLILTFSITDFIEWTILAIKVSVIVMLIFGLGFSLIFKKTAKDFISRLKILKR